MERKMKEIGSMLLGEAFRTQWCGFLARCVSVFVERECVTNLVKEEEEVAAHTSKG